MSGAVIGHIVVQGHNARRCASLEEFTHTADSCDLVSTRRELHRLGKWMAYGLRFFAIRGKIPEFFAQDPTGRFMLLASDVIVKFVVDR
jgi:hypothetical protein